MSNAANTDLKSLSSPLVTEHPATHKPSTTSRKRITIRINYSDTLNSVLNNKTNLMTAIHRIR